MVIEPLQTAVGRFVFMTVMVAFGLSQSGCVVHQYVDASDSIGVAAATDNQSCILLAERQRQSYPKELELSYRRKLQDGTIIRIKGRTNVRVLSTLGDEGGRLVPIHPMTAGAMSALVFASWVVLKDGTYAGRTVCIVDGIYSDAPPYP